MDGAFTSSTIATCKGHFQKLNSWCNIIDMDSGYYSKMAQIKGTQYLLETALRYCQAGSLIGFWQYYVMAGP